MKQKANYLVDVAMLVAFALCGVTGVLKMPEIGANLGLGAYATVSLLHDWSGIVAVVLVLAHFALHARWMAVMTGRIVSPQGRGVTETGTGTPPRSEPARARVRATGALVPLFLAAAMLLAQSGQGAWAAHGYRGSTATVPEGIDYPAGTLQDGVYEGSADGYMPGIAVRVTVKGGRVSSVEVTKNNETPRWWMAVANVIPQRIVAAQSTDVDIVSGATSSSHGIMSAVEDALRKAAKGGA